jgi:hypothetical protein
MAKIVVAGYMIRHPVAGMLLTCYQYLLGLHLLGHHVVYVEESGWPDACYDPLARRHSDDPTVGLRILRGMLARHGLSPSIFYVNRHGPVGFGDRRDLERVLATADLLLNVGGVCWLPQFEACPRRTLIDMDPLFTQLGRFGGAYLRNHHLHFTYGTNIGRPGCSIPTCGLDWRPLFPPVVPSLWQGSETTGPSDDAPFTTIANWTAYGAVEHEGQVYGQKDQEFLRLINLPSRTSQTLELALSGAGMETVAAFRAAGWWTRDAGDVTTSFERYREYVMRSRGELSAAKHAYVATHSGWFSDRSVCYLAAGRPVILQDTGFGDLVPTGCGVLAFSTAEEALDCIERINKDYQTHCSAARRIAKDAFDFRAVLPPLLDAALSP